ncbi:MAG: nucleotidyltransferase domain-containing protein [Proteobacteria bacterium]|jgi:predicted nucleotidyltransferase|nr:nucleotidyltransferase domain-containing protein [Pseudomonadota bacterium]
MDPRRLLAEIRAALEERYGQRLHRVVLYGSLARGDETPDSDLDLLVVLSDSAAQTGEMRSAVNAVYPVLQRHSVFRPLHVVVAARQDYEDGGIALYRNVHREGIAA